MQCTLNVACWGSSSSSQIFKTIEHPVNALNDRNPPPSPAEACYSSCKANMNLLSSISNPLFPRSAEICVTCLRVKHEKHETKAIRTQCVLARIQIEPTNEKILASLFSFLFSFRSDVIKSKTAKVSTSSAQKLPASSAAQSVRRPLPSPTAPEPRPITQARKRRPFYQRHSVQLPIARRNVV